MPTQRQIENEMLRQTVKQEEYLYNIMHTPISLLIENNDTEWSYQQNVIQKLHIAVNP